MPVLEAGADAPNISLTNTHGQPFSLDSARKTTTLIASFFKVGCPTCQYAFPFLERIANAYPRDKVTVVGVSQDKKEDAEAFAKTYGVTFPILLDDTKTYPASNAYGLTNVPSTFVVSAAGKVEFSSVGWVKDEITRLNEIAAQAAGREPAQIFKSNEQVLDFKAG